jgi:glucose/arabinose dehydrogenase
MKRIYTAGSPKGWDRAAFALFVLAGTFLYGGPAVKRVPAERDALMAQHFRVTELKGPAGVDPQVGAILPLSDGRVAVAFHRGEIAVFDLQKASWSIFAEGLHEPLGLLEDTDGSLLVMQRPELTRLKDMNGDGAADVFETVWDGFGMTGNYHEFAFGPLRSKDGKLFVALNLASSGASVRSELRGEWLDVGLQREAFYQDWKSASKQAGRMYSRVPWRGWVMEIDPKTGVAQPFASGFRSPDGLGWDAEGNLLVSDNQGDWRGTSELHVVKRGGFYGHPASLPWRGDWAHGDPLKAPVEVLEQLRTPAAVWFPQGTYANSPTQMVRIPKTAAWGPYGGHILIGEMNVPKLLRVTLEEVHGVWQGACYPMVEMTTLKAGLHRLAFVGDRLLVGRTHLSWAGGEHLGWLESTGNFGFDVMELKAEPDGFNVRFSKPADRSAVDPSNWSVRSYTFAYWATYGSPEMDSHEFSPESVSLSEDGLSARLKIPEMRENFVYDFNFGSLRAADGSPVLNQKAAYTLRRKP